MGKKKFCEDFQSKMQNALDGFVRDGVCAGASIAVGSFGELVARCNSGWANIEKQEPICGQTRFQMFSLTKPVTAVAIIENEKKPAD